MANRKDPAQRLAHVWNAFWALTHDRPVSFGVIGRIPFMALDRYADRYGIVDPDAFERLRLLVGALDDVFIDHITPKK